MERKIYSLRDTKYPEVWVNGEAVPKDILELKLISEKKVVMPASHNLEVRGRAYLEEKKGLIRYGLENYFYDTLFELHNEHEFMRNATPKEANAYEPAYYSDGSWSKRGMHNYFGDGEIPVFFIKTHYFHINEENYRKFCEEEHRKLLEKKTK